MHGKRTTNRISTSTLVDATRFVDEDEPETPTADGRRPSRANPKAAAKPAAAPTPARGPAPPIVSDLADFAKLRDGRKKTDDERIAADVPEAIKGMIEHLAIAASPLHNPWRRRGRSRRAIAFDCAGEYCLSMGLHRIDAIEGVRTVGDARDSAVEHGTKELDWFNHTFRWSPAGQRARIFLRVRPELHTELAIVADSLGLDRSKIVALALALALLDAPLPDADNALLAELCEGFAVAVRERAKEVTHRMFHATPTPAPTRRRTDFRGFLMRHRRKGAK